jgi:predicted RNA-binding protein YlqC (UPF0109 family)
MSEQAPVQQTNDVRLLIEKIAKSLVDSPDQVIVDQYEDGGETVVELEVAETDLGKIIGRHGRTAKALRTLLSATGVRSNKRYDLEILE